MKPSIYVDAMVKLNIIEDEAKSLILEFDEADRGIAELIKDKLLKNKDVSFTSVIREHPQIGKPRLVVKSEKNARPLVLKAVEEVEDDLKELASKIPKK